MTESVSVSDAIKGRYSVRAFLSDPVPEETIREIFDIARLAPSNSNTQPWHVSVVSGAARNELERRFLGDMAARRDLLLNNWRFFGAPHAAFFSMPETMHRANAVDMGIFLQSVMLLMAERGIGSCPQGALAAYPAAVREIVGVPDGNALLCGLSFGYEDPDAIANEVRMPREPLERIITFTSELPS